MEIIINYESYEGFDEKYINLITAAATETVLFDGRIKNAEVSISIVTSEEIQKLNKKYRGMDSVTDVLSFPLHRDIVSNDTDEITIGDIVICLDRVKSQAQDYRHSFERELAFLTVHGALHLLGYDHIAKSDEDEMIYMQHKIMEKLNLQKPKPSNKAKPVNPKKGTGSVSKRSKNRTRFIMYTVIFGFIIGGLVFGMDLLLMRETEQVIAVIQEPMPVFIPLPPDPEPEEEPEECFEGLSRSHLTGLFIDEEAAARRPFAVTINNMRQALPQSGISQAGIIYAVLAEGGITRLVAVFDDFESEKIGPVRSARDYFLSFSYDNSAIFVHHGGSPQGYDLIRRLGSDNLDGMRLEGSVFFRDPDRFRVPAMREHSSFTSSERLIEAAERFETLLPHDFTGMFDFYEEPTTPTGAQPADEVIVPFSTSYPMTFIFDAETRLYSVFHRDNAQIDAETGEQLTTTNIIVKLTTLSVVSGDTEGRLDVVVTGGGSGYIITNGSFAPITWQKSEITGQTQFFSANGERLRVNVGQTWICVHNGRVEFN
ncbi:MAG: rRNA maturation RNase YbeY [Defluviitaleaceae bacterium]|nr:rRNA maturation RNase YbeY [Defluviitaleaceae bacterium]